MAAEKSREGNEVCAAWRADSNNTWLSVYAEVELLEHESILGKWLRCREGPLRLVEGGKSRGKEQQIDLLSLGL